MRFLTNNSTDPYFNMAFDEYCLENILADEPYFYLWRNRPSVIIGLNQNVWSEVNLPYLEANGITLARRVTGGGAVYHDLQNLNYTIIGADSLTPEPIVESLRRLGVAAELTGRNDIFVEGRKISGYARRVSKHQEIIHGTLMYDVDLETLAHVLDTPGSKMQAKGIASVRSRVANLKDYLPGSKSLDEVQAALQEYLSDGDGPMDFPPEGLEQVRKMAEEKFSTWDFIYGHSHEADLTRKAKLPCGTVEASLCIYRGKIRSVVFSGDFLFDEPADPLAHSLMGCRFERTSVSKVLEKEVVSRYFRNTTSDDLIGLLFTSPS
ncbi:MAG: lipoate--protein ligase [Bacteroidales bacterium]|nr:lipoate--protein ligase [Bacteroidales bacterium]